MIGSLAGINQHLGVTNNFLANAHGLSEGDIELCAGILEDLWGINKWNEGDNGLRVGVYENSRDLIPSQDSQMRVCGT